MAFRYTNARATHEDAVRVETGDDDDDDRQRSCLCNCVSKTTRPSHDDRYVCILK